MITRSPRLKIVIAGYIVGGPLGGLVWHHLQYVLGLLKMGHEVLFAEQGHHYPSCYNPLTNTVSADPSYGLQFISDVFSGFGINDRWAYFDAHKNEWKGRSRKYVEEFSGSADIFLNLSGVHPPVSPFFAIPVRIFIDTDPAFTQIAHLTDPAKNSAAKMHTHFFSYGENFGKPGCTIPDDGYNWKPTRQPVVLAEWPYSTGNENTSWTTVMQWDSYKTQEFSGRKYGMKSASFDPYLLLASKVNDKMELAIGCENVIKEKLINAGWLISNPLIIAATHREYQHYIRHSKGEWSVAKQGYVISKSGWFSERSAAYLASGRPVLVQDTGFPAIIETGKGLLSFSTPEEAVEKIKQVNMDYDFHCKMAAVTAAEYFESGEVLKTLINSVT